MQAASLVAAFNGGFLMQDAQGGYYTEGRAVFPLVEGAASLVMYADGSVTVGAWGSDVTMTPDVVAVRQNLVPLVEGGQPTAEAANADWHVWGDTCGATSCASSVPGLEYQWRSSVGITGDGALVYAAGPALNPTAAGRPARASRRGAGHGARHQPELAGLRHLRSGAPDGPRRPSNGQSLEPASIQGPSTFFDPAWARDFVTMSARVAAMP